jgi:amino acid transporter
MKTFEKNKLKRVLSRADVLALSFGSMIGWGWIMLPGQWIHEAGVGGALIAFLIGGFMFALVGLTYAELTPALPIAGGEMAFAYRGLGQFWAWVGGWSISFAYIGVASWEAIAISTACDYLFHIPKIGYLWTVSGYDVYLSWAAVGIAGGIILTALNIFGVKPAAIFQIMGSLGLVICGILFIFGGAAFGSTENIGPLFTGFGGLVSVLIITPSMYLGFDVISQSTEEMNIPLPDIAKVLMFSIFLAAAWYILIIIGTAIAAPALIRDNALVPVADVASYAFQVSIFGKIMIMGGVCGILTSWNGYIVGASRIIFAMGNVKMLPRSFAAIHPKYQTPVAALAMVGFICCLSPLLGKNASLWFLNSAAVGTIINYLMVSISFIIIRKREPFLARPFEVKRWKLVGAGAIASSLFFLYLFTPFSGNPLVWTKEWILIIVWILLGIVLAFTSAITSSRISKQERELLLFGTEYSRDDIDIEN